LGNKLWYKKSTIFEGALSSLAAGLRALHRVGIVHGDVKCANFVLGMKASDDLFLPCRLTNDGFFQEHYIKTHHLKQIDYDTLRLVKYFDPRNGNAFFCHSF
jgi:hypothetical protein